MITCPGWFGWIQDVGRQFSDTLMRQAREADVVGRARRRALTTPKAVAEHQAWARERFATLTPELPTGGDTRHLGELRHGAYTLTRLLIEAFPGRWMPAAVWRHEALQAPAPGVLFCSGHYTEAWRAEAYQQVCLDLARHGFVVLSFDPPGQGELLEYPETPMHTVAEHMHVGLQCLLTGGCLQRYFVGHSRRALDALCEQPDVLADRIGITGQSGGGTQTVQMMLADPRLAAAAPSGYVHDLLAYMDTGQTHDHEQIFVGLQGEGFSHADALIAFAPRPCRVLACAYDFFPIEATLDTIEQARTAYRTLGADDQLDVAIGKHDHHFSAELREAAVRFFAHWLQGKERYLGPLTDAVVPQETLVFRPPGMPNKTVFELNLEFLDRHRARPPTDAQALRALVRGVLAIEPGALEAPIWPHPIVEGDWEGHPGKAWGFWSEPGVCNAAVHYRSKAPAAAREVWMAVLAEGSDDSALYAEDLLPLLDAGHDVALIDVRGVGALRAFPKTCVNGHGARDDEYFAASSAFALGASLVARRVFDVLRGYRFVRQEIQPQGDVCIVGCGLGALHAYLAAALEPGISRTVCREMIPSWRAVVETRIYDSVHVNDRSVIPGVLQDFDLPDLAPCFAGRALAIERPPRLELSAEEYAQAWAANLDDGRGHRFELRLPGAE